MYLFRTGPSPSLMTIFGISISDDECLLLLLSLSLYQFNSTPEPRMYLDHHQWRKPHRWYKSKLRPTRHESPHPHYRGAVHVCKNLPFDFLPIWNPFSDDFCGPTRFQIGSTAKRHSFRKSSIASHAQTMNLILLYISMRKTVTLHLWFPSWPRYILGSGVELNYGREGYRDFLHA